MGGDPEARLDDVLAAGWSAPRLRLTVGELPKPPEGVVERQAVRGVIERAGALLMIRSAAGDLKFPGGGVEPGETLGAALAREVREECGRTVTATHAVVLVVDELRPARTSGWVLRMKSAHIACDVGPVEHDLDLDGYERELGFRPVWVRPADAIAATGRVHSSGAAPPWVARELRVLKELFHAAPGDQHA